MSAPGSVAACVAGNGAETKAASALSLDAVNHFLTLRAALLLLPENGRVLGTVERDSRLNELSRRFSALLCFSSFSFGSIALLSGLGYIGGDPWTFSHILTVMPASDVVAVKTAASTARASSREAGGGLSPAILPLSFFFRPPGGVRCG
jgi:hypothetical protein